ncbi:uncharacterized protein LOC127867650 isoform X3 [Dreissena polymorpha]|uniref:uncharacterized protein LOC127867650 isoform X3 n=1 Tax=Dreissena polymorpha TaxID=45954 RepID=UPI00226556E4|nr:uncharacterized protein LOC127867650 isoform X3 [Dreissena polymorpha]
MTVLQPVAEEKMAADTKILSSVHVGVKPPDDDKKMHYDQNLQTISKPSDEENHKTSSIMDGSYEEPETSLKERNELYAYVNIHHEESTDDFIQVEDGEISSREQIPLLPMTLSDRARSPRNIHVEQVFCKDDTKFLYNEFF